MDISVCGGSAMDVFMDTYTLYRYLKMKKMKKLFDETKTKRNKSKKTISIKIKKQ